MHEFTASSWIVETVAREAVKLGVKEVKEVHVVVGKLSLLRVEQVEFWYDVLKEGTVLEKSKLVVSLEEGVVKCPSCGYEGPIEVVDDPAYHLVFPSLRCPRCGDLVEVVRGRDCRIVRIVAVRKSSS